MLSLLAWAHWSLSSRLQLSLQPSECMISLNAAPTSTTARTEASTSYLYLYPLDVLPQLNGPRIPHGPHRLVGSPACQVPQSSPPPVLLLHFHQNPTKKAKIIIPPLLWSLSRFLERSRAIPIIRSSSQPFIVVSYHVSTHWT